MGVKKTGVKSGMVNGAEPFQVSTDRSAEDEANLRNDATPRMPHERDESHDSQAGSPRADIKQAFEDVTSGQVDTDCRLDPGVEETVDKESATSVSRQQYCAKGVDAHSRHDQPEHKR